MTKATTPNSALSNDQREVVERLFLLQRMKEDEEEFDRFGEAFVEDHLIHTRAAEFNNVVATLQSQGCSRNVLFRCLYRFYNSLRKEAQIPYASDIDALVTSIRDVVGKIKRFEKNNLLLALRLVDMFGPRAMEFDPSDTKGKKYDPKDVRYWLSDFSGRYLKFLELYADRLPDIWWRPRKDIIKSHARIACCLYPKIATRDYQNKLVAQLLNSFDNKDETNSVRSLEINRDTFLAHHPMLYKIVEKKLRAEHRAARKN